MNHGEEPAIQRDMILPDDVLLKCLACVSRIHYPTLSLVCKRFRSLIASTELYQTRTLLGRTESSLYVCLRFETDSQLLCWFILCQRPNSSRKVLVPISSPKPYSISLPGVAVVGPSIYAIGGGINNYASSRVMVMDSCSHTWREAPSMLVARMCPSACTFDGKIYVTGGCDNIDSTNWMEIFDTKTQTWEFLQIPSEEICGGSLYQSAKYEGTLYVRSKAKDVIYKLHKSRWRSADLSMNFRWGWRSLSYCVIENVFYCFGGGCGICWYNPEERLWKTLKGLEGLPSLPLCNGKVKLADHCGKMAILWVEYVSVDKVQKLIWCAEIAIEKRQNGEIWGTLEWFDNVFTSNEPNPLVHALTSTVC
ncbi:PREDICTED: F-box/kelch-repeat protein At4g23580-like [Camelina sativa]|uniref:F-box/kelch-repeat protein At4g23580-like n=1 Tax=Camelina sativa TaxID=90675 RepID=A0ABM0V4Q0_CAMSA|nr:PREDICTED: F-box/kelch-repeat protein At4g23580-like [Camelina sativa]